VAAAAAAAIPVNSHYPKVVPLVPLVSEMIMCLWVCVLWSVQVWVVWKKWERSVWWSQRRWESGISIWKMWLHTSALIQAHDPVQYLRCGKQIVCYTQVQWNSLSVHQLKGLLHSDAGRQSQTVVLLQNRLPGVYYSCTPAYQDGSLWRCPQHSL